MNWTHSHTFHISVFGVEHLINRIGSHIRAHTHIHSDALAHLFFRSHSLTYSQWVFGYMKSMRLLTSLWICERTSERVSECLCLFIRVWLVASHIECTKSYDVELWFVVWNFDYFFLSFFYVWMRYALFLFFISFHFSARVFSMSYVCMIQGGATKNYDLACYDMIKG